MLVSIIIRTYNEETYLEDLLKAIHNQDLPDMETEVIVIDSGSTDRTVAIAKEYHCRITYIKKETFSFGRSLNHGCAEAKGEILVSISGHCIPVGTQWLSKLIHPILQKKVEMTYGRQVGGKFSKFSECQLFEKYFPNHDKIPQESFFANNANSAFLKNIWDKHPFDEELTGLEDMHFAKRLMANGGSIGYVCSAAVYHLHHETWGQVKRRYFREAMALRHIMPEVQISFFDFIRYFSSAVFIDYGEAIRKKALMKNASSIFLFRLMQFWGSYRGNHEHRRFSKRQKEFYFFPKKQS